MRKQSWAWLILVAAALTGALAAPAAARPKTVILPGPGYTQVGPQGQRIQHPHEAVADRLIVAYRPTVAPAGVQALAAQGGGQLRGALRRLNMMVVDLPAGSDLLAAAQRYSALPEVAFAVPDTLVYPQLIPNDPQYSNQYHLPLCQAPAGWDVTTGSAGTLIAIIDSGVDLDHPDLAAKIWTNPNPGPPGDPSGYVNDLHGWNFAEGNNNVNPIPVSGEQNETVSHGTLSAGLAAAVSNEGWGAAGIDWHARIMPVKVFDNNGFGTTSGVIAAIDYAVAHGAKVLNLSLGGPWNQAWTPAITSAHLAGCVVVSAGGNNSNALTNSHWESPVCNDSSDPANPLAGGNYVIGVSATDRQDRKAWYSNWDESTPRHFIDIDAPGDVMYGPVYQNNSFPGFTSYWGTNSGTSFSAPIVSGLAGLLLAQNPSLTPDQVLAKIRAGADSIDAANPGYHNELGAGRVNIARSLGVISPPQPARSVAATDTPGDEGGSLTVTWLKSLDDGAGANNVTSYGVRRREGLAGAWLGLPVQPAGTQQYVDATTTDGVDYFYLVRTFAGTQFSDSSLVGPVRSRNDQPPPPVTALSARDHPGDAGGAIDLSWTYTPPPDFQEYRLYRERYKFTTVTGRTPLAVLTAAGATSYRDTPTSDGVDYYYALTAVDKTGNENKNVSAVGPVQSFPNTSLTFPAGIQLLAPALVPPDQHPATLLGIARAGLQCARYDPTAARYVYYTGEPLPAFLRLAHGRGLWVNLAQPVTFTPSGQTAPTGDFPVSLQVGWQMVGNPFLTTLDFSACTVTYQGSTMDLLSAETAGLVRAYAWIWDRNLLGYRLISAGSGGGLIAPWQGFWMLASRACTLNLVAAGDAGPATASVRPAAGPPEPEWRLQLTAQAGPYHDVDNYLGVAPAARQVEAPPGAGQGVELALEGESGGPALALRYLASGAGPIEQPLTVSWAGVTGPVRLGWPEANLLPASLAVTLTDPATGQTVNLRNSPGYTFEATEPIGQRRLLLRVMPRSTSPLAVTSLTAAPSPEGVQVVFVLSQPASCDIRVMNIAGRNIRQLLSDTLRPAGQNVVPWDTRNQGGARVPAGRYLLSLEARDDQGNLVRILRDVVVAR